MLFEAYPVSELSQPVETSTLITVDARSRSGVVGGVGVDEGAGEFGHRVGEGVFGLVRNAVGLGEAGGGVDVEFGVGVDSVSDPAHFDAANRFYSRFFGQGGFGGVDEFGVDAVHQAAEYVAHGGAQDREDGEGDE